MSEGKLQWYATGNTWKAQKDGISIVVPSDIYEKHVFHYLAQLGIEKKSREEYMRPGEEAWKKQCEAVETFEGMVEYWLTCEEKRVEVTEVKK